MPWVVVAAMPWVVVAVPCRAVETYRTANLPRKATAVSMAISTASRTANLHGSHGDPRANLHGIVFIPGYKRTNLRNIG